MTNLKIINLDNSEVKSTTVDLDNDNPLSSGSIAYVLNWQLARRRSGSAKTKSMAEISGTTAKPYKQKGTGRARQGSRRSVQFKGGRACFGPTPRSFDYAIPKKIIKKALRDALKLKISENKLILFSCKNQLKTNNLSKLLETNNIDSALFLYQENDSLSRSIRNIKNVKPLDLKALNVYDLLKFNFVMLDENLLGTIKEGLLNE